jgi:putative peptidoglycan lipid II flippase
MFKKFSDTFGQHRLLGGAIVLAITQFGASLAGLIRDSMLNRTYPGLSTVDVYISSFRLSDLLFQMTIMAGISTVLVPLLSRYKANDKHDETSWLLSSVMTMGSMAFGGIALILAVLFPYIAPKLVGFEGEELQLYITFGRLALLTNFLFVFGNALGQYLITVQKYWIYGLTPILYTGGTILGTLLLSDTYGQYAPMIGTVAGAVIYVLVRLAGAIGAGFRTHAMLWHPDLRTMGWLMLPRMAALGALQLELLVFDSFASGLDAGSVTINANARNFQSVVVGVVGIALAQSAFPLLSKAIARKEFDKFGIYLRKGIQMILALTIPGAIVLVLAAPIAARLVNLTHVLPVFWLAIAYYAFSIPFESLNHLLLRSFYALHRTTTPAIFSVLNGTIAILVSWMFVDRFGVYALALGFTAGQIVQLVGLGVMLPKATAEMRNETSDIRHQTSV